MDDYGISLPGGIKPEPNVNATLRVLTIHHDLTDTVKVIYGSWTANILSWLAALVVFILKLDNFNNFCHMTS